MTTTRIRVNEVYGGRINSIVIRPDKKIPGQIFYRGPVLASLTEPQAIELANALADMIEQQP